MGGKGAEARMLGKGLHQPWAGCHSRLRQALQQAEVHTAGHSLFLMLRINTRENRVSWFFGAEVWMLLEAREFSPLHPT